MDRAVRADGAGVRPRRRRGPLHPRQLRGRRRRGARRLHAAASCARRASTWAAAAWPRRCGCPRWSSDGLRLLRALGFHGVSQVEFKLDPRTGEYKLIEVNPRLWQWHGLPRACGVDLTHIAYLDLVGRRPPPQRMTHEGRRWAISFMAAPATPCSGRRTRTRCSRATTPGRRSCRSGGSPAGGCTGPSVAQRPPAPPPGAWQVAEGNGGRPLRVLGVGDGRSLIFLRWAWRVAELGHDVHIVSDRLSERPGRARRHHRPPDPQELELGTRIKGLRRTRFAPAIRNLARKLDVDVVHAHYLLPYGYWAAEAGVHPLVMSPWNTDIFTYGRERPRGRRWVRGGGRGGRRVRRELDRQRRRDGPPGRRPRPRAPDRLVRRPAPVRPGAPRRPASPPGSAGRTTRS